MTSDKGNRQVAEQFEALGRFVQAFEHMVLALRQGIAFLTTRASDNQNLINIITNSRAMTAQPLWDVLRTIIFQVLEDRETQPEITSAYTEIIRAIDKEFSSLLSSRNALLHGTWFIGYGSSGQTDFPDLNVVKVSSSHKNGHSFMDDLPKTASELILLSKRCEKQRNNISRLTGILSSPEMGFDIRKDFKCENGRWNVT